MKKRSYQQEKIFKHLSVIYSIRDLTKHEAWNLPESYFHVCNSPFMCVKIQTQ